MVDGKSHRSPKSRLSGTRFPELGSVHLAVQSLVMTQ